MSRIDDLIAEHCPDGVEFRTLGEILELNFGTRITKLKDSGSKYPVYGGGGASFWTNDFNREDEYVVSRFAMSEKCVRKVHGKFWMLDSGFTFDPVTPDVDKDFVAYWLFNCQPAIYACTSQGAQKNLKTKDFLKFRIPIPPLIVQREIVGILERFTQLEAELEAELEKRRQQYSFYSEELLVAGEEVPRVRLGDVATLARGASPRPIRSYVTDSADGIPWIKIGDVPEGGKYISETVQRITPEGAKKSRLVKPGDFVLSNSMSFGRPYISQIEGCIHDGWLAISDFDESFLPDYLYYLLRSSGIQAEFARLASAGTVKNLKADTVRSVMVPLPAREDQARIVSLLDKFDALTNDLSSGLPAEIDARRKQYEYYRDKLLTFEELPA